MRGNAAAHELVAPGSLSAVLDLLAAAPGAVDSDRRRHRVDGRVRRRPAHREQACQPLGHSRTSLHRQPTPDASRSEAGRHSAICAANPIVAAEFPLLDKAASWIGSIANQSARDARRQPCQWLTGSRLFAGAAGLRRGDRTDLRARQATHALFRIPHWLQTECDDRR